MKIPKVNEERNNFPSWKEVVDEDGNELHPVIYCKCGQPCGINKHEVDKNGAVKPSFFHQHKKGWELEPNEVNGCGFHEYIELEGYKGNGIKKPNE